MRNHVGIDRTGLIDIQAEAGEVLQPQVPVAVDRRILQPRVEIGLRITMKFESLPPMQVQANAGIANEACFYVM